MSINPHDDAYLELLRDIQINGHDRGDRTGVGTRAVFGRMLKFDLTQGFPLLTTKRVFTKAMTSELLWFIEGSGDERRLAEILYGKPRSELTDKTTIWTDNAQAPYWKPKAEFEGDLGSVYGVMWRRWPVYSNFSSVKESGITTTNSTYQYIDQLAETIEGIKTKPHDRRHIVSAWNPGELNRVALPPCHMSFQFFVRDGTLSCMMTQRSADVYLGIPFNIASYALLTEMVAQVCGLKAGELTMSLGDTHLYSNHHDQVTEQLSREPRKAPKLWLNPEIKNIDDFTMADIRFDEYDPHPAIKAAMAV